MIPPDPSIVPACHAAVATLTPDGDGWLPAAAVLLAGLLATIMPCTVQMAIILSALLSSTSTGGTAGGPPPVPHHAVAGPPLTAGHLQSPPPTAAWVRSIGTFLGGYMLTFMVAASLAALLVKGAGWFVGITALQVAGGLLLAAFGLQMLGWVRLPGGGPCGGPMGFFLGRPYRGNPRPGRMGMTFALYCAGCCGPAALGSAMLLSGTASAVGAMLMLMVYAVGMAIPFIILAAGFVFALRTLRVALRYAPLVTAAGACVAVVTGTLLALRPLSQFIGG
jgi:cytochrome c-type biogenesis protein